ncbi:MAG: TetR/AcrR family transcriptional regulator [Candidatus Dadabacteria bacterium]|nr:MAG: TetR/AcrR family transcriptional regulator [Candidatus Dadabacteria bacterium]
MLVPMTAGSPTRGTNTARPRRGRPPRADARRRVLEAAAKLFADHGYEQTTVEDLIQESGVSRGTFYKHFDSREAVLAELYQNVVDELMRDTLDAIDNAPDVGTMIRNGLAAYINRYRGAGALAGEVIDRQYAIAELRQRREQAIARYVGHINHRLQILGFDPIDPILLDALLCAVDRYAEQLIRQGGAMVPEHLALLIHTAELVFAQR